MWKEEIRYKDLRFAEKLDELSTRWGCKITDKTRFIAHREEHNLSVLLGIFIGVSLVILIDILSSFI